MQALLFRRFFFAVRHAEAPNFCKKESLRKLCLKLKNESDLQLIANLIRFFAYA